MWAMQNTQLVTDFKIFKADGAHVVVIACYPVNTDADKLQHS